MEQYPFEGVFYTEEVKKSIEPLSDEEKENLESYGIIFPDKNFVDLFSRFLEDKEFSEDSFFARAECKVTEKQYDFYIDTKFFTRMKFKDLCGDMVEGLVKFDIKFKKNKPISKALVRVHQSMIVTEKHHGLCDFSKDSISKLRVSVKNLLSDFVKKYENIGKI